MSKDSVPAVTNSVSSEPVTKRVKGSLSSRALYFGTRDGLHQLFSFVVLLLLLLNLFMNLQGATDNRFTFERILSIMQEVGDNDVLHSIITFRIPVITGDWYPIDFLRLWLNNFVIEPLNVLLFLVGGVATIVTFFYSFLSYIFV